MNRNFPITLCLLTLVGCGTENVTSTNTHAPSAASQGAKNDRFARPARSKTVSSLNGFGKKTVSNCNIEHGASLMGMSTLSDVFVGGNLDAIGETVLTRVVVCQTAHVMGELTASNLVAGIGSFTGKTTFEGAFFKESCSIMGLMEAQDLTSPILEITTTLATLVKSKVDSLIIHKNSSSDKPSNVTKVILDATAVKAITVKAGQSAHLVLKNHAEIDEQAITGDYTITRE